MKYVGLKIMRISPTKVIQYIDSDPPEVVIVDNNQVELAFNEAEVVALATALNYFLPAMQD